MLAFTKYAPGPWWSEALIMMLALIGIGDTIRTRTRSQSAMFSQFLALYTVLMTVIYSVIPYKTPWCMLGFLHGMILMAGIGAVALYRHLPHRLLKSVWAVLLIAGAGHLGIQAYRSSFVFDTDTRNPYVYAQTSKNLLKLVERAEQIADVHPAGHDMLIKIMVPGSDYWPLPWYLRRFSQVGYWEVVPDEPEAAIIIAGPELETQLDSTLHDSYQKEYFGLRPHMLLLTYVRSDLWDQFIERMK